MSAAELASYIRRIREDPSFKGCISKSLPYATFLYNMKNETKLNILKENFMTVPVVIYTRKNFYLLGALNEKIEEIKSSGLLEYWHYKGDHQSKSLNAKKVPKVLTIKRLVGCFEILVWGLLLSFLSFSVEILVWKYSSYFQKPHKSKQLKTKLQYLDTTKQKKSGNH